MNAPLADDSAFTEEVEDVAPGDGLSPGDDASPIAAIVDRDPRAGQGIDEHKVHVTLFENEQALNGWHKAFTLPELAELVLLPIVIDGKRLRLLKLAQFGSVRDVANSLCNAANAQAISGIEVRYAGDEISPAQAVEVLSRAGLRCVVYVMPEGSGWTILLPLSKPLRQSTYWCRKTQRLVVFQELPAIRELLTARVNGLFGGELTPESFAIQQPFGLGDAIASKLVEGEFLNIADRTYAGSIFRDGSTVRDRAAREAVRVKKAKGNGENKAKVKGNGAAVPDLRPRATVRIIELGAVDVLTVTEMSPADGRFAGKQIMQDGTVEDYPHASFWNWATVQIPATPIAVFDYLKAAQRRNVYLIRGVAKEEMTSPARRLKENFLDQPSQLHFFDIDGVRGDWQADPEAAVKRIVAQFGAPWASASFSWFFSSTHGLKVESVDTGKVDVNDKKIVKKYWRGETVDGKIKVRLAFILGRAVSAEEAENLTKLLSVSSGIKLDPAICRQTQPNYTARIRWHAHPEADVLGDIERIGWVKGAHDFVDIPEATEHEVRWARAQGGAASEIADHPDAVTAVRAIASDGRIRDHLKAAVVHLHNANPRPESTEIADHAVDLADKLRDMIELNRSKIDASLKAVGRGWEDVWGYLPKNMTDFADWVIRHLSANWLSRKTIQLSYEPRDDGGASCVTRQTIVDRVRRTVHKANDGVTLLIAPTGTFKSTEVRKAAVAYLRANPDRTVVILIPRHDLADEFLRKLHEEHPDLDFNAAIWRGRHRDDPEFIGPTQPARRQDRENPSHDRQPLKAKQMCLRADEAEELEAHLVDVNSHLCRRGRGANVVTCPLLATCGYWRQKRTVARLWIGAHELLAHEMPETFGSVGRIFIDEDPTDAFVFGTRDEVVIPVDKLRKPPSRRTKEEPKAGLMQARLALHQVLDGLTLPTDRHLGAPATREILQDFFKQPNGG